MHKYKQAALLNRAR